MRPFGTHRPGLADAFTIGNALCGAAAILVVVVLAPGAQLTTLRIVALLLLAGVVFDVCDGAVARARGGSPLGPHLDSLADLVAFGVAPAVAVGGLAMRGGEPWEAALAGIGALAYTSGAIVRLADFDSGRKSDPWYTGMPSPTAAVTALAIGFLALPPWLTAIGLAVTGWLMVSPLRYPRSRGAGLVAEAAGLLVGVTGIVGLIDVRIPAAIALAATLVVVPAVFALHLRRRVAVPDALVPEADP